LKKQILFPTLCWDFLGSAYAAPFFKTNKLTFVFLVDGIFNPLFENLKKQKHEFQEITWLNNKSIFNLASLLKDGFAFVLFIYVSIHCASHNASLKSMRREVSYWIISVL